MLCAMVLTPATDKCDAQGRKPLPFPFAIEAMCHDNENGNWIWGRRMWTFDHVERTNYGWTPK